MKCSHTPKHVHASFTPVAGRCLFGSRSFRVCKRTSLQKAAQRHQLSCTRWWFPQCGFNTSRLSRVFTSLHFQVPYIGNRNGLWKFFPLRRIGGKGTGDPAAALRSTCQTRRKIWCIFIDFHAFRTANSVRVWLWVAASAAASVAAKHTLHYSDSLVETLH